MLQIDQIPTISGAIVRTETRFVSRRRTPYRLIYHEPGAGAVVRQSSGVRRGDRFSGARQTSLTLPAALRGPTRTHSGRTHQRAGRDAAEGLVVGLQMQSGISFRPCRTWRLDCIAEEALQGLER